MAYSTGAPFLLHLTLSRFLPSALPGLTCAALLLALVCTLLWQIAGLSGGEATLFASLGGRDWALLRFTFFQAALSTILALTVGLALAWALSHQRRFFGRSLLVALFSSALVMPTLVVVLGLITVLGRRGWLASGSETLFGVGLPFSIYGLGGILLAHAYLNGSFCVQTLLGRLEAIPAERRKLVRSLGLSAWQRFRLIEWPAVRGSIAPLATTIFLLCFTSFAIVLLLGGSPRYNTLEVAIFEAVKLDFDLARALDLALLQLLVCAVLVTLSSRFRVVDTVVATNPWRFAWPDSRAARALQWSLITFGAAVFVTPLLAIVVDGIGADFTRLVQERSFQQALITSLLLASLSALLATGVALLLAAARRDLVLPNRLGARKGASAVASLLSFSALLYLAFPALVLSLGFFLLARQLPGGLTLWASVALLVANLLMALPFALAIFGPALEKIGARHDQLAFSLGLSGWQRWRLVEWPLLRHDVGMVLALSFCLSLGDLGVIALFGSQDFATLPWYLYQKMGSYRTDDAAGVALIMLVLTLTVYLWAARFQRGGYAQR
ncbi:MAG: ABC transporter permease subunit [Pseudomonadota bacterium]